MKSLTLAKGWTAALAAVLLLAGASSSNAQSNTKLEANCYNAIVKGAGKHIAAYTKALAACEASGAVCPNATADEAIAKSAGKIAKTLAKKCARTCNVSGVPCVDSVFCPPNGVTGAEACEQFNAQKNMKFPGALCEAVISGSFRDVDDIVTCATALSEQVAAELVENLSGDVLDTVSDDAAKCASGLLKTVSKSASSMAKAVSKCRTKQLTIPAKDITVLPNRCAFSDAKTASTVAKAVTKVTDAVEKQCSPAELMELDLCGLGVGGVTTVEQAQACLGDIVEEAGHSIEFPETKDFLPTSIINIAYPSTSPGRCGDGLVNQIPNQFFPLGEECDGDDDDACPGECFPPGDIWQCTCSNVNRARSFADGPNADLDNGWSGASHNAKVANGAGFVTTIENCDCDEFDPVDKATCIGTTSDPICDVQGTLQPRCTYDLTSGAGCDSHGNGNGENSDPDCQVCDAEALNPGNYCEDESDCDSQCYTSADVATGDPCIRQSDCDEGETCRGRCDKVSHKCLILHNGAPLPLTAEGTAVCVDSRYASNVSGTRNIVTGEHAVNYNLKSLTVLAQSTARPCPVCGGWCAAGTAKVGEVCDGTCSGSAKECRGGQNIGGTCANDGECPGSICVGTRCRFDEDCPVNETCTTTSYECLGAECTLDLICAGGDSAGEACRIEATTAFGTTSADCALPVASLNISGSGLDISFTPLTSEPVILESPAPCEGSSVNFDCNCVTGGGAQSQPNRCTAACDAGINYGLPCGGVFSKCVNGSENGVACDTNADCSGGGTCTNNPNACGGGSNDGDFCSSNSDCNGGGTCGDACPGGHCVPMCVLKGVCNGGFNDGGNCGVDAQCPGACVDGVNGGASCAIDAQCPASTCGPRGECEVPVSQEEGVCAAGKRYHCNGPGQEFRPCQRPQEGTTGGCEAVNVGAGICVSDVNNCFANNGAAEGGDTFNGKGDPTNARSVTTFCIPASSSPSINGTAGLPGPGRLRQPSVVVPNFTVLP